ncbi:hypothetical protein JE939_002915 [Yersinia ruckeri]|nr:hypothetical protein [Yersinia ruckeri]
MNTDNLTVNGERVNLSKDNVIEFFTKEGIGEILLRYMSKLDSVDHWTFDFNEKEDDSEIKQVITEMEILFTEYTHVLHDFPDKISYILSHMTTTRCLYLINFIGSQNPNFVTAIENFLIDNASLSENDDDKTNVNTIQQRFDAIERTKMLNLIFSNERFEKIIRIMGDKNVQN